MCSVRIFPTVFWWCVHDAVGHEAVNRVQQSIKKPNMLLCRKQSLFPGEPKERQGSTECVLSSPSAYWAQPSSQCGASASHCVPMAPERIRKRAQAIHFSDDCCVAVFQAHANTHSFSETDRLQSRETTDVKKKEREDGKGGKNKTDKYHLIQNQKAIKDLVSDWQAVIIATSLERACVCESNFCANPWHGNQLTNFIHSRRVLVRLTRIKEISLVDSSVPHATITLR